MANRSTQLSERLKKFNDEVIAFVEGLSEGDWKKLCKPEDWPVGVTARHIGASHYQAALMAKMIINGRKLPELTADEITEAANLHAREHADCTKAEVLEILKIEGNAMAEFVRGLSDPELDRSGRLFATGRDMTAEQFIDAVVLKSAKGHFESMKAAVA